MWDYVEVCSDFRVLVMIMQYSACFGTELAMNTQLATHFRTYFQMDAADASALAGAFGLMNLFARSLGGITSDILFKYMGFRGRIWAQFLSLFFEAIFLFCVGLVDATASCLSCFCFYRPIDDPLLPFQVHAGYVMVWALLSPCYYWAEHGGMFDGPAEEKTSEIKAAEETKDEVLLTDLQLSESWRGVQGRKRRAD
ncbi:NRT2.1 [Symbiodinium sp. CCMP2592]|nr:NRT2.1 [Symbiodinium sp. CCMP2592]